MGRSELGIHPILNERYSIRAFSDRDVTDTELELVLEAARWAPSSHNEQPWRFLVTRRGGEGHTAMMEALLPKNRRWAEHAPVLILNMASHTLAYNGEQNFHSWHDLGLALGQLTVQATAMGLGLNMIGGFDPDIARKAFSIPSTLDLVSVLALGYSDDTATEVDVEAWRAQRSVRKSLGEIVSYGRFTG